ncbi:MAG: trypsin-like serine protease [Ruminococcaceae bacterium]|nr:trypsin-like serine protease [Oscillospiraceae bacterium]
MNWDETEGNVPEEQNTGGQPPPFRFVETPLPDEPPLRTPYTETGVKQEAIDEILENPAGYLWFADEDYFEQEGENIEEPPYVPKPFSPTRGRNAVIILFSLGILLAVVLLQAGLRLSGEAAARMAGADSVTLATERPPEADGGYTATEIATMVLPSVVSLQVAGQPNDMSINNASGSGSGVILSENGYIATNAHVIHEATAIQVMLDNGELYRAEVVGTSPEHDLAVIKIKAAGLTPATFGDSDLVQVGQRVLAIGNAAGVLPGSLTQGIISGVQRDFPLRAVTGQYVELSLLQHDAATNPGNSGGALVNAYGQVIGINVAKLESETMENISFAIPASMAVPVLNELMAKQG